MKLTHFKCLSKHEHNHYVLCSAHTGVFKDIKEAAKRSMYVGLLFPHDHYLVYKTINKIDSFIKNTFFVKSPDEVYYYFFKLTLDNGEFVPVNYSHLINNKTVFLTYNNESFFVPSNYCTGLTKKGNIQPYEYNLDKEPIRFTDPSCELIGICHTQKTDDVVEIDTDLLTKQPLLINKLVASLNKYFSSGIIITSEDEMVIKCMIIAVYHSMVDGIPYEYINCKDKDFLPTIYKFLDTYAKEYNVTDDDIINIANKLKMEEISTIKDELLEESIQFNESSSLSADTCYQILVKELVESNKYQTVIDNKEADYATKDDKKALQHKLGISNYKIQSVLHIIIKHLINEELLYYNLRKETIVFFRKKTWFHIGDAQFKLHSIEILRTMYGDKPNFDYFYNQYICNVFISKQVRNIFLSTKGYFLKYEKTIEGADDNEDLRGFSEYFMYENCVVKINLFGNTWEEFFTVLDFEEFRSEKLFYVTNSSTNVLDHDLVNNPVTTLQRAKDILSGYFIGEDPNTEHSYFDIMSRILIYNKEAIFKNPYFYVIHGESESGKTTLINKLCLMIAPNRFTEITFLPKNSDKFALYPLKLSSVVMKEEIKGVVKIDAEYIKNTVNFNRVLTVEEKRETAAPVRFYWELMLFGNEMPLIPDSSRAVSRRMRVLNFTTPFSVKQKLATEVQKKDMNTFHAFVQNHIANTGLSPQEFATEQQRFGNLFFVAFMYNLFCMKTGLGREDYELLDNMIITTAEKRLMQSWNKNNINMGSEDDPLEFIEKGLVYLIDDFGDENLRIGLSTLVSLGVGYARSVRDYKDRYAKYLYALGVKIYTGGGTQRINIQDVDLGVWEQNQPALMSSLIKDLGLGQLDKKIELEEVEHKLVDTYKVLCDRLRCPVSKKDPRSIGVRKDLKILSYYLANAYIKEKDFGDEYGEN